MKKVITLVCLALIVAGTASAQKQNGNWREKVRSEKIAFITMELDLSEAEAQVFWPVYNDVEKTRREAFQESRAAAKALKEALAKGEGDVNALLDEYLAKREKARMDAKAIRHVLHHDVGAVTPFGAAHDEHLVFGAG